MNRPQKAFPGRSIFWTMDVTDGGVYVDFDADPSIEVRVNGSPTAPEVLNITKREDPALGLYDIELRVDAPVGSYLAIKEGGEISSQEFQNPTWFAIVEPLTTSSAAGSVEVAVKDVPVNINLSSETIEVTVEDKYLSS